MTMVEVQEQRTVPRKYHEKEAFVTGHSGTTAFEIFAMCLVIPLGLSLYYNLRSLCRAKGKGCVVVESVALIAPMLVVNTSFLPHFWTGPAAVALASAPLTRLNSFLRRTRANNTRQPSLTSSTPSQTHRRRPEFLSVHRACVYLLTTIAILAVDFPLFPRKFCKTEVGGYGWMDLGAASYVIIAGWTSALAEGGPSRDCSTSLVDVTRKAIKKCAPLLLLGFVRLATNKGLEYQEHVSEYGVHWNFFLTLCCVEGSMVTWKGMRRKVGCLSTEMPLDSTLAFLMMVPYQLFLSSGGGQEFIENGDRTCNDSHVGVLPSWLVSDLPSLCHAFVANREGVLGVFGYLSLRLLSEDVARICFRPTQTSSLNENRRVVGMRMLIASLILWAAHLCLTEGLQIPTSRRSTNASFLLWSLAHNTSLLYLIHVVVPDPPGNAAPPILDSVNRFGLAVFLFSNVLTGVVNLTIDTLHTSNATAMFVLSIYLALVCGMALLLGCIFEKNKID